MKVQIVTGVALRVFGAVLGGAKSVDEVAEVTGLDRMVAYRQMLRVRKMGLIDWAEGKSGTLRATVAAHPPIKEDTWK